MKSLRKLSLRNGLGDRTGYVLGGRCHWLRDGIDGCWWLGGRAQCILNMYQTVVRRIKSTRIHEEESLSGKDQSQDGRSCFERLTVVVLLATVEGACMFAWQW